MAKQAKGKRAESERASEWYLHEVEKCTHTVRAIRTKWQRVDFYACDVMGKRSDGTSVYAQITAGQVEAVRRRRRKLDKIPWHPTDTVLLLQLVHTQDPANARRKLYFYRVHRLNLGNKEWSVDSQAQPIAKDWFTAWKNRGEP